MLKLRYWVLRWQVYTHEIKHWRRQVEHLLLLSIAFLGTALPALFFGSLLAYGVIFDAQSSLLHIALLSCSLVFVQSIILSIFSPAILGLRYLHYLASVERNSAQKLLPSVVLSVLSNPILSICLLVLVNTSGDVLDNIPHAFVLLAVLIASSGLCLYKPRALGIYCCLLLLTIAVVAVTTNNNIASPNQLTYLFAGFLALVPISAMLGKVVRFSFPALALPIWARFWLVFYTQQQALWLSILFASVLLLGGVYAYLNLPQYALVVTAITSQLLVITASSLQLGVNKYWQQNALFFSAYKHNERFVLAQSLFPCIFGLFLLTIACVLFSSILPMVCIVSLLLSLWFARLHANYFAIVWLVSSVAIVSLAAYL